MISNQIGTISAVAIVEANIPQRSCTGATVGPRRLHGWGDPVQVPDSVLRDGRTDAIRFALPA